MDLVHRAGLDLLEQHPQRVAPRELEVREAALTAQQQLLALLAANAPTPGYRFVPLPDWQFEADLDRLNQEQTSVEDRRQTILRALETLSPTIAAMKQVAGEDATFERATRLTLKSLQRELNRDDSQDESRQTPDDSGAKRIP